MTVLALDVDDDASVAEVFGRVGDSIDVLVNNADVYSINSVEDESLEQFRRVMETNYFGVVRCVKQVLPAMRKRGSGHIINVSSVAGRVAFSATSAYNASKFALEAFSESLAQEIRGYGVKVALVEPGIIDTAMATTSLPQYDADTIYPHGRRIHAFFTNPTKAEASPTLVAAMIRYVIESGDGRLRFPVGPDALLPSSAGAVPSATRTGSAYGACGATRTSSSGSSRIPESIFVLRESTPLVRPLQGASEFTRYGSSGRRSSAVHRIEPSRAAPPTARRSRFPGRARG